MDLFGVVAQHGYAVTVGMMFVACCGLPLPLSVVLLTAGAEAHHGSMNLGVVWVGAVVAGLCGDTVMYLGEGLRGGGCWRGCAGSA